MKFEILIDPSLKMLKTPVWYVPDLGDNREETDLDACYQARIQPLVHEEAARLEAYAARNESGALSFLYAMAIEKAVIEIKNPFAIQSMRTGAVVYPETGVDLVKALRETDHTKAHTVLESMGPACLSTAVLTEGELGNLKRRRESSSINGKSLRNGRVRVASESPTHETNVIEGGTDIAS